MTAKEPSPGSSPPSTGYPPDEPHWRSGTSRSPTFLDSRFEHRSPQDRVRPTMDICQQLLMMLREHRRQEDEARDKLIKQIRQHREQQDDLLLRIAMQSPSTFLGMFAACTSDLQH
jgi:hypothetical protein